METKYCEPSNCGLMSTPSAVSNRIGKILDALSSLGHTCEGQIQTDVDDLRFKIITKLRAEHWRIENDRRMRPNKLAVIHTKVS